MQRSTTRSGLLAATFSCALTLCSSASQAVTNGVERQSGAANRPAPISSPDELLEIVKAGGSRWDERPTLDKAAEIERLIAADRDREWMAAFSPSGELLTFKKGDASNVKIAEPLLRIFKGATVIHNHPSGTLYLSPTDLDLVRKHGVSKMIVVAPDRKGYKRKEWSDKEATMLYPRRRH